MASKYSVTLEKIINEFGLETIYLPCDASEISITSQEVNRPGLLLAGNDKYFDLTVFSISVFLSLNLSNHSAKKNSLNVLNDYSAKSHQW